LVLGPTPERPSAKMKVRRIESLMEMLNTVTEELKSGGYDIVILAAAGSDFGPTERPMEKISSGTPEVIVRLKPLPKVVEQVKKVAQKVFLVGFKAEYNVSEEELIERAYKRLKEVDMDLIVANDVSKEGVGFAVETNEVYVIDGKKKVAHISLTSKINVAKKVLDIVVSHLSKA